MLKMRSTDQRGKVVEWIDGATVHRSTDVEGQEGATAGFAWNLYDLDLKLFTRIIPIVSRDIPTISRKDVKVLKQSLGNLFLWGDGFRDGRLESVLEESDDLKETLVSSLVEIGRLLVSKIEFKVRSTSTDEEVEDLVRELKILLEKARILRENDLDSEITSDGDNTNLGDYEDHDNLSTSITSLATYTTCLMDLLPSMEDTLNFASQAKDEDQSSSPLEFHVSGPARTYILNIFDRFPKANCQLVERLGEANWQRHIALRNALTKEPESAAVVIEEAPKSVFVPVSLFQDSGVGTSLPAHTSYAFTSASHTSFVSSQAEEEGGGLRVPPTPKAVSTGIPFSCEICGQTLSQIKNRIDWKRHVFADLKPYICTFSDCKDALRTFPTRKMWETHEFDHHRFDTILCCLICPDIFPTEEERHAHLRAEHGTMLEKKALGISLGWYDLRNPHEAASLFCPLCLCIPGNSRRNFITHVGKHMESIALAALPRENGSESESDSSLSSVDEQILNDGGFAAPDDLSSLPHPDLIPKIGGLGRLDLKDFFSPYVSVDNFSAAASSAVVKNRGHDQNQPTTAPPSPELETYTFPTTTTSVEGVPKEYGMSFSGQSGAPPSVVGMEGMPQPALRPRESELKFTPEDDQLLVDLIEENLLTWKQIVEFFPGRSAGTLQVRYCAKLKRQGHSRQHSEDSSTLVPTHSVSQRYEDSGGKSSGKGETEKPHIVSCICDSDDIEESIIQCETCNTWQHSECYYPGRGPDPLVDVYHTCVNCKLRAEEEELIHTSPKMHSLPKLESKTKIQPLPDHRNILDSYEAGEDLESDDEPIMTNRGQTPVSDRKAEASRPSRAVKNPVSSVRSQMDIHSFGNGSPPRVGYFDKQWHFEVPDEPLYTPADDAFDLELQMPQPTEPSSLSQFGQFNPNFIFPHETPQDKTESPQYVLAHPQTKQKTFQFSHTTAADFSEK